MKLTSRNDHQSDFIESLYQNLRKETELVLSQKKHYANKASSYVEDGLLEDEAVELMIIETGLPREACQGYICMASQNNTDDVDEFLFQFEDESGKVWTSIDFGQKVYAKDEEDAWQVAENMLDNELLHANASKIISLKKIGE